MVAVAVVAVAVVAVAAADVASFLPALGVFAASGAAASATATMRPSVTCTRRSCCCGG